MDAVADRAAIVALLDRYGVAIDARRWNLFDGIFAADARLEYFGATWDGLAAFRADFAAAHDGLTATHHGIGNHVVAVTGDRAAALSYCQWRLVRAGTPGGDAYLGCAWYDDGLARRGGGWRITRRRCGLLWTEGNPRVAGADRPPPLQPLHRAACAVLDEPFDG